MNSNMMFLGPIVIGLLVCYFIWREMKKTQEEVNNLKTFSNKVASYIEISQQQPASSQLLTPQPQPKSKVPETIPETEEKEE